MELQDSRNGKKGQEKITHTKHLKSGKNSSDNSQRKKQKTVSSCHPTGNIVFGRKGEGAKKGNSSEERLAASVRIEMCSTAVGVVLVGTTVPR